MQPLVNPIIPQGNGLSIYDLRNLAQNEPVDFVHKVQKSVLDGKLRIEDLKDLNTLYRGLADVTVKHKALINGIERTVSSSAFPVLVGATAVAAVNDAYTKVETVGQDLVMEFDDNKKISTVAQLETLDAHVDEVKELRDFPEVGAAEESFEIRHRKNGRKLSISVESILENDLPDIVSRLNKLGEIMGTQIENLTLKRVTDYYGSANSGAEPYVYRPGGTGTALFSATANTPGSRAPNGTCNQNNAFADETDLEDVRVHLASMIDDNGDRLAVPRSELVILCPDEIVGSVLKVLNSEYVPGVENEVSNWGPRGKWHIPQERVLSTPRLSDLSTSAWYYGAPKKQFRRKWKMRAEVVTLGQDTQAYLNSQIAFQARIAWDCEVGAVDYVYWVQNLSATTFPIDE